MRETYFLNSLLPTIFKFYAALFFLFVKGNNEIININEQMITSLGLVIFFFEGRNKGKNRDFLYTYMFVINYYNGKRCWVHFFKIQNANSSTFFPTYRYKARAEESQIERYKEKRDNNNNKHIVL